jgi:hypothetical protein
MKVAAMNRRLAIAAWAFLLGAGGVPAQEAPYQEDLRFVRELRARRYNDLALEYLQKLARNAPPELARELPLELAKTRLESAADEPDTTKRLALYAQAQAEFEKFLAENKGSPRAGEITLDLAQVAVMRGRTQLSRALLQETPDARDAEGARARELLVKAGIQLQQAAAELDRQVAAASDTTPEEKAARKRLEDERLRAELAIGLNLFDQGQTYSATAAKEAALLERGKRMQAANRALEKLATQDPNNPVCWVARAWAARCLQEIGDPPDKVRARLAEILEAPPRVAADAQRLARYFRLLVIKESPDLPREKREDIIIEAGNRWLIDYPTYARTPEGTGLRYLLGETLVEHAETLKAAGEKGAALDRARSLLRGVEATENDYTDRARRLKVVVIGKQGGFTKPVADLRSFEDCYVRAQYEIMQMGEDARKLKGDELEKARKAHVATLLEALGKGLKAEEARKATPETNSARALYAFYALNAGKYQEAIRVGEAFARSDPRSSQAAMAASYALEAHAALLAQRERQYATPEELKDDKDRLLALARYMEERWPRELAGDLARHQIAMRLMREENYPEAIKKLEALNPTYPSYALAQFQLAEAAFKAEKDRLPPLPGDKPGDYHRRALAALERIAEPPADAEPRANRIFLEAKVRLASELFRPKKYAEMEKIAQHLQQRLAATHTDTDPARDKGNREQLTLKIQDVLLYATYGLAETDFSAQRYPEVAKRLDPLVQEINEGKLPQVRKNVPLGMALLGMALKADVQLGQLDKTRAVIKALQGLSAEGGAEAGTTAILSQLAVLIQQQVGELRKKNNEANLKKAIDGYSALLDDIVKQTKNPTPKFVLLLARCYSNMGQHRKAVELLESAAEPPRNSPDVNLYHGIRLMLVRELRLSKDARKAQSVLDEILGPDKGPPGWGRRNIDALKERLFLLEEEGKYAAAARLANDLVRQLLPKASTDNAMKEHYLECYYHVAYCFFKHGQGLSDPARKEKMLRDAANQIVQLEKKWENFGSDASARRFEELLAREPELKAQYEQAKAGK